jgi:hypothetical protein
MRRAGAWSITLGMRLWACLLVVVAVAILAAPASASDGGGSQTISARVAPLLTAFIDATGTLRGNSTLPVSVRRVRYGNTTVTTIVTQP